MLNLIQHLEVSLSHFVMLNLIQHLRVTCLFGVMRIFFLCFWEFLRSGLIVLVFNCGTLKRLRNTRP